MPNPIQIRMGGYGPPTTGFSRSLKFIGDRLAARFGDRVDIKYLWNVMDFGYKAEEIVWLVESGILSLGYQSSSYLTDRMPELGFVDLPFLFSSTAQARAAMDGALGARLTEAIESRSSFRVLGWFENGFRHISNRVRPVRMPADLKDIHIRVLPSQIQARTFELLGARPQIMDLTEAIAMIKAGTIDAQENPLPTIQAKKFYEVQKYIVLTGHITDALLTIVGAPTWNKLSDADKTIFADVLREGAARATAEIVETEKKMAAEFEKRGKTVVRVGRKPFRDATVKLHNGPDATWPKDIYDRLQAIK